MADQEPSLTIPLLPKPSGDDSEFSGGAHSPEQVILPCVPAASGSPCKSLAVLGGHAGSVSCLALCGEFVLSASKGRDIIAWQQPDLRLFTRFGHGGDGGGAVKALAVVGHRVFSAHQDGRIRVWRVSRRTSSENVFRLAATLPTSRDYLGKFLNQENYVQVRRNHRRLWIEHADSISCLAVAAATEGDGSGGGLIYSGSWDKSLKVWRVSDLKCLESIRAHDDAINAIVAHKGMVYSASADGKIKVWRKPAKDKARHCLKTVLKAQKDLSWNSMIVSDDGRFVYGGGSDGRVMGWELEASGGDDCDQEEQWRVVCDVKAHEMSVLSLCSVGEYVWSGSADRSIGVWRRESGGELRRAGPSLRGHGGPVKCLQAASHRVVGGGGFMVYSGGVDKSLRVWWVPKDSSQPVKKDGSFNCIMLS